MPRRARIALVGVGLALGLLVAVTSSASQPAQTGADSTGVSRVERTIIFPSPWRSTCSGNACTVRTLFSIPMATPAGTPAVDVTVTVSLDYRITAGDFARAHLRFGPQSGSLVAMPPGRFPLRSTTGDADATTLSWAAQNITGGGQTYVFELSIHAHDGSSDRRATVTGTRLTAVVEGWSAGD
jgi:hypothetical protein